MSWDGRKKVNSFLENSKRTTQEKVENFAVYSTRQNITRFLVLHELFKLQMGIKGSIVECGVFKGQSIFSFAHFSSIYEPSNHHREVIGFDTFEGFPGYDEKDQYDSNLGNFNPGFDSFSELEAGSQAFQSNHYLESKRKIKLIKGDAQQTIPEFIANNRHFICSMLYIDFDLYAGTKVALEYFLPRMPKGALLVFDEIHNPFWPGETEALEEVLGIRNVKIQHFTFNPEISYIVLE